MVNRDEVVAEPEARGANASAAAAVVDAVLAAWQARDVVTWLVSVEARPGGLMF